MPKPTRKTDNDGLYKRPDSSVWWASYTDATGRRTRRSTGTVNRREAEALLAKWKLEAHRSKRWQQQPSRMFDELMLAYLKATQHEKASSWRDEAALKHLFPVFSGREINSITSVELKGYIAGRKLAKAAASTINKEVGLLSAAINYANEQWGWQLPNPAAGQKQKEPEGRVRWLKPHEAVKLIEAAQKVKKGQHLADFVRLALHTGMRKGEILALEWDRVDLNANILFLESSHTKTRKRRSIPLNHEARQALLGRARFRAEHCPVSPWVFAKRDGSRIGDVKNAFETARLAAGIDDFRIHDLRHTCAAWLVTAGVPLPEVRDLLGHRSITMTERYAHLAPDRVRAAVAKLEGASRFGHG